MDCRIYEPPYETEPTTGEHDYNTCEGCQNDLKHLREAFKLRFNGTREKPGFPLCCEHHAGLAKLQIFSINDFKQVPDWTAKKIIYTWQHIKNHIFTDDYYKEITDYIDYTIDSFGQTPNDSEPLYLGSYLSCITDVISDSDDIPKGRRVRLLEYLKSFNASEESAKTDFNILTSTYERWFKIFPWQMSFFASLKPQFEKLPIIQSVSQVNKYSGKAIAKPHTKNSLIELLLQTTGAILTQINGLILYEKGIITDLQKTKVELIMNERRSQLQRGYINKSLNEEQRYRKIIRAWFIEEKKFIDDLTQVLSAPQPTALLAPNEYRTEEFLGYFSGRCSAEWKRELVKDIRALLLSTPTDRQITALAKVIYDSGKLHDRMRPKTFNKWLEAFARCWNRKKPTCKPNAVVREIEDMKSNFSYVVADFISLK